MVLQYITRKIKEIFEWNKSMQQKKKDLIEAELFNMVLNKCISEDTHISGIAGTGKSTFLANLTDKLYKEKKTYLMCANSVHDLTLHFQKHTPGENILVFILDSDNTHTIDIKYLFSLEKFLNFVCISDDAKETIKSYTAQNWFTFFDNENNAIFFKQGYFNHIRTLIQEGYIDEYGDLNEELIKSPISAYVALDNTPKFRITQEEKDKYIFLFNLIQLSLSETGINVIFDEERVFFSGLQNNYADSVNILGLVNKKEIKNNYIFSSQILHRAINDVQIVYFKSFLENSLKEKLEGKFLVLDLTELRPGHFMFFDKTMNPFRKEPFVVPLIKEDKEIEWDSFLNNKQKKLHTKLQEKLQHTTMVKEKRTKI